jgi:predicted metal-binding protein
MTASFQIHIAAAAGMMEHYDPSRVHGYCASCPQHGRRWSCPPFEDPPLLGFPAWDHAVLVFEKVWTEADSTRERMIARFHEARRTFRSSLLEAEALNPGSMALVAGYCPVCKTCSRPSGEPCRIPAARRYSLEAVGFDVTGLSEGLAGQKVLWPQEGLPDYLMTVGAILCFGQDRARGIGEGMVRMASFATHDAPAGGVLSLETFRETWS